MSQFAEKCPFNYSVTLRFEKSYETTDTACTTTDRCIINRGPPYRWNGSVAIFRDLRIQLRPAN